MADITQRLNYFDRQFLRAADFQLEQAYDLDRRRRHNRLLHAPGIAEGLMVSGNVGDTFVTVSAGTAYDALGQEIVLAASEQVDVSTIAGATAYITIAYGEQASDPSTDPGVTGDTRILEQPSLAASATMPANPNLVLPLASVALASGKVSGAPNNTVRHQAGSAVIVPPDLTLSSVTLQNPLFAQSSWPRLVCSGANTAALQNAGLSLVVSAAGALGPQLTLTNIGGGGANAAASVDFNTFPPSSSGTYNPTARIEALDVGNEANDIVFLSNNPGAANNVLGERLRITSRGYVGIGTPAPRSIIDADMSAPAALGPVLTLTNTGGGARLRLPPLTSIRSRPPPLGPTTLLRVSKR
jgi:hypothetical protein